LKPAWWGAPLVQKNNYQAKQPEIRRDDGDVYVDVNDMTIQETET